MKVRMLVQLLLFLSGDLFGQTKWTVITGAVHDENESPLEMVNVQVVGTYDGDVTDSCGKFLFRTSKLRNGVLRASLIGYESVNLKLSFLEKDTLVLSMEMNELVVKLKDVIVAGNAFTTGDEPKALTLHSLDVFTTAGAAADIFRAIQTFPGVAAIDEGSGLFVRGGDVNETTILLDQATVVHPYKFESPTGGFFGTIPPFLIGGTFFSSGGFSARYGNALSGVLAMESLNMPSKLSYSVGIGLAAGSISANIPLDSNSFGIRISGNKSFTDAMLRLNGFRNRFTTPPDGIDGNVSLIWKYSPTAQIKFFNFVSSDQIGVQVDEPSFAGVYASRETNWFQNLQWAEATGQWLLKGSLSLNRFLTEQELGSLDLKPSDITYKARFDADADLDDDHRLSFGAETEKMINRYDGTVPQNPLVLDPQASVYTLNEDYSAVRVGVYSEVESAVAKRIMTSVGIRSDYYTLSKEAVVDPRVSLRYNFSNEIHAQASWGIYHQFAEPYLYNQVNGNPQLSAQSARHFTAGAEYSTELLMCRVEMYLKRYSNLVLQTESTHYANLGDGSASGLDFFLKYGGFLITPVSGWISYSYLHSRRLQARNLSETIVYEEAPSSFDITHNLTVVGKIQLIQFLSCGLTFRYATGRPVTPIIGAIQIPGENYFEPIQGHINSERLPDFVRLDASLGYFMPFGDSNSATFYFAVSNLMNRDNPIDYEYSPDYSQKHLRTTDYLRSIYFGVVLSFGSYGIDN
ncbi:MAG TPA: TonB-dependent receptor [Candidatus Acidoferrales bacterium]|nr:TonB-dependent receptor [Candidatus Acidoferrales bacterium]